MLNLREAKQIDVAASIRLMDGTILNGYVNCGLTGKLENVLSAENSFVEYTSKDGQKRFIGRHQIASVEPMDVLRSPSLRATEAGVADPYTVLGIYKGCTLEQAKDAYHRLSKMYHPDRWTGDDIPSEIVTYVSDKFRQINAAFTALRADIQAAETAAAQSAMRQQTAAPMQSARPVGAKPLFGQG